MQNIDIQKMRRQPYLSQAAYENTIKSFEEDYRLLEQKIAETDGNAREQSRLLDAYAGIKWISFQLKFTAGVDLEQLSVELQEIVEAYERYVDQVAKIHDGDSHPGLMLDEVMDVYVDYVNLVSVAVLLHREDLLPKIYKLIANTEYDGSDAIIEELFKFFLNDRPELDDWTWDKPYRWLLEAIDAPDFKQREVGMRKYVKSWYREMKGQAGFWGKHEQIDDTFSPYFGYWAMCSAAFSYLYEIDDTSYQDELVYPKDLVEYARSKPRASVADGDGSMILRVPGGQSCPRSGMWFSPAKDGSQRFFERGDILPAFLDSDYGSTIWQWISTSSS